MTPVLLLAAAAALPLGIWPETTGAPIVVQDGIEVYQVEPEDDYWVLAVQPLVPSIAAVDRVSLAPLVAIATRLGADAVLLLGELSVSEIPEDLEAPLAGNGRWAAAAFLVFDCDCEESAPKIFRSRANRGGHHGPPLLTAAAR